MITNAGKDFQATQMFSTSPGSNGANYIALTANATAPVVADTALLGEFVAASGGLNRVIGTYAHTTGTGTTTISKTFTANANDGTSNTVNKAGLFNLSSAGVLVLETVMPSPPTLVSGDSIAITWTQTF
jgi:hypothetical protein